MARRAEIYIAGIGEVDRKSFIATAGMVDDEDVDEVVQSGACAEILGQFFTAGGRNIPNGVSQRALAPRLSDLQTHKIVAVAGGTSKTQAIRAILGSGLLHGLITDEATARRLVNAKPGREPGKKNGKSAPG
jgi:DNA-binding transcriptional regulator LsrR (DeoR family)